MEKSHVTLEQHVCPVCLKKIDTGNLLFNAKLEPVFDKYTVTGYELCDEHRKVIEDGYVILVEVNEKPRNGEDPYRTGNTVYLKRDIAEEIFEGMEINDVAFVEVGVIDRLQKMIVIQDEQPENTANDTTHKENV